MKKATTLFGFLTFCLLVAQFVFLISDNTPIMLACGAGWVICGIITYKLSKKTHDSLSEKIDKNPAYSVEKKILEMLNAGDSDFELISSGALLAIKTHNSASRADRRTVMTKKVCFKKVNELDADYVEIQDVSEITCKEQTLYSHTYGTKNASVVGRAVAGGVAAGAVGAVVGAASAVSTNASGGVSKTYSHNEGKVYPLLFGGEDVQTVALDNALITDKNEEFLDFLEKHFSLYLEGKYIYINNIPEKMANRYSIIKLQNYLFDIIEKLKANK